jgi:hypothetical protein
MTTKAHLRNAYRGGFRGRSGWWLVIEYDESVIERLKQAIPSDMRTWDEEQKRWWVALEAEDKALSVIPGLEAYRAQGALL